MDDAFDGFVWDQVKSDQTLRERGLDFDAASTVFDDMYLTREDLRQDYGERRFQSIGIVQEDENLIVVVVWTPRDMKRRIISARLASRKEREEYGRARESS